MFLPILTLKDVSCNDTPEVLSFGFALRKYAYVQSDGPTALEAWQPWGFYFGQRYHEPWLTTC